MKNTITFKLNGRKVSLDVAPHEVLLEALRDRLGVKSPKCGCDRGDCGTCTVMIDGRALRSCMVLAIECNDHEVTTLEGLMPGGTITPLQQALLDRNAFQCGFCAPGMILSATELLRKNPQPDEHEIKEAIAGNLCRCTGYTPIVEAIKTCVKASATNDPTTSAVRVKAKLSAGPFPSPLRRGEKRGRRK